MEGKGMTLEQLRDFVKEHASGAFAELMKENHDRGLEAIHKSLDGRLKALLDSTNNVGRTVYGVEESRGIACARIFRAHAAARKNGQTPEAILKSWGEPAISPEADAILKAFSAGAANEGAPFIPAPAVAEIVSLLRSAAVVRALGARVVQMTNGTYSFARQNTAANAEYVGENRGQRSSKPTVGNHTMVAKKMRVTVSVSNDQLRYSSVDTDAFIRDDMVASTRSKEDSTFLRSAGGEFSPKGMRYLAAAANVIPANGTVNLANITEDLGKLVLALEEADIQFVRPGWVMAPRTRHYLMTVRDGNGNYVFRPEMLLGTLWGMPYRATTAIPRNLGVGGNESEIMLAEFSEIIVADDSMLEIVASNEAAYKDENNDLVSAYDLDQTVLRGILRHDIAARRAEAIAVLTGVTWGA